MEASSESAAHASDAVANHDAGNHKPANHVEVSALALLFVFCFTFCVGN